jgi:elongation factor G
MTPRDGDITAESGADPRLRRNVVLVGPAGSGKTTLIEHLLHEAGVLDRVGRVEDGTTACDRHPLGIRLRHTVEVSIATLSHGESFITLIDTPGDESLEGGQRAGLRAADGALFVFSAVDGIDLRSRQLWSECEALGVPRAIVITHLDEVGADFDESIAVCQRALGDGIEPIHLPIHGDDGQIIGFIDLLTARIRYWGADGFAQAEGETRHWELIGPAHLDLVEAIASASPDGSLMNQVIAGEQPDATSVQEALHQGLASGHLHPILGHAIHPVSIGSSILLDLIAEGFPSPLDRSSPLVSAESGVPRSPLLADPKGPLCAEVIQAGLLPHDASIVRVFSGILEAPVTGHAELPALAGSVTAIADLTQPATGQTISSRQDPLLLEGWQLPEPTLAISVHELSPNTDLALALQSVVRVDPTVRIGQPLADGGVIVWCCGQVHADLVMDRLQRVLGRSAEARSVRLGFLETFRASAVGLGSVELAPGVVRCKIEVQPSPGHGLGFADRTVPGTFPANTLSAIEAAVRQRASDGLRAGYPLTDVEVRLTACSLADRVDLAAVVLSLALEDAAARTTIDILEPMLTVTVDVPDEYLEDVVRDLAHRRARVLQKESTHGSCRVTARVPEIEASRYSIELRSLTGATAHLHREAAGYAPMPERAASRVVG